MSAVRTTPAAVPTVRSLPRRLAGGTLVAGVLAAAAIALWPASEADKARADGERYGEAVAALYAADSPAEADAALADMHAAAADTRAHAGDAVADQVAAQEDALARAADGAYGAVTSDDEFSAELYEAELDTALDDLDRQAEDFRTTAPEVEEAFWDGYRDGRTES